MSEVTRRQELGSSLATLRREVDDLEVKVAAAAPAGKVKAAFDYLGSGGDLPSLYLANTAETGADTSISGGQENWWHIASLTTRVAVGGLSDPNTGSALDLAQHPGYWDLDIRGYGRLHYSGIELGDGGGLGREVSLMAGYRPGATTGPVARLAETGTYLKREVFTTNSPRWRASLKARLRRIVLVGPSDEPYRILAGWHDTFGATPSLIHAGIASVQAVYYGPAS